MAKPSPASIAFDPERYRLLVEESGDMITSHRPGDWAYTAANPAVERQSGYRIDELLGRPVYDFFHPDDAEAMKRKLIPAIYHQGNRTFRYRNRRKDGSYHWLESTHRSIRDPDTGELLEIVSVSRDITHQVQAEANNRRLAALVDAAHAPVLFCDQHHAITYANQTAQQWLAAAQATSLAQLLSDDSYRQLQDTALVAALQTGEWRGSLALQPRADANASWLLEQLLAPARESLSDADREFILVLRDVTEQKRAQALLEQQQLELAHANRLLTLGEMVSSIAHEINQPLATSLNYARGLLRQLAGEAPPDPARIRTALERIVRQTQHAADIIRRLRGLVKKAPAQRSQVDLPELAQDALALLQAECEQLGVRIEVDADAATALLDRVQIQQVLINLLRNALEAYRAQPAHTQPRRIVLRLTCDEQQLRIEVCDWAGGMDSELQQKIFEPYFTTKRSGLGLGLSISRSIVEAQAGSLSVVSDGSSYSQFIVTLPQEPTP